MTKKVIFNIDTVTIMIIATAILFVGKLAGWFSVSWLWVFSPIWIPVLSLFTFLGFIGIVIFFLGITIYLTGKYK